MDEEKERTNEGLVVIRVFQGCINEVVSNLNLKVVILDEDVDGEDEDRLIEVDGDTVGVEVYDSGRNPDHIEEIKKKFSIKTESITRAAHRKLNEKIRSGDYEYLGGGMIRKREREEPSDEGGD